MTAAIRHTLREWLRLVGWAVANTQPPIGFPPARVSFYESSARGADTPGRLTHEEQSHEQRKHGR